MPQDEQRRMNYAYDRMMKAEARYLPHCYVVLPNGKVRMA